MSCNSPDISVEPLNKTLKRFCIVVIFAVAFAYIEAAIVVYLRTIFYQGGFTFPLPTFGGTPVWRQLILIEVGREAASMVLIFSTAWLIGRNNQQRFAFVAAIFAVWDIFFYIWLKFLINWPASIMDWDILFLIPSPWASPVIAPLIVSLTLLIFALIILYRSSLGRPLKVNRTDLLTFFLAGLIVVVSFCLPGPHITHPHYKSYFHWPLFASGQLLAIALFIKCLLKSA
jgi:hypothetical protein